METNLAKPRITICMGSSCFARGNENNLKIIQDYLARHGLTDNVDVELNGTLCLGKCGTGPNVIINNQIYNKVNEGVMLDILKDLFPED
jgi:NADH:ubiquinone oxidoreductase subunit E